MNQEEEIQKEIEELNYDIERSPNTTYYDRRRLLEAELKGIQETEARILGEIENVLNEENTDIQTFDCDCGGNIPDINKIKQELTKKITNSQQDKVVSNFVKGRTSRLVKGRSKLEQKE